MPYFVMEYVDGLPLTEYCDRKRLDLRARVALFMKVCEAVAAAHRAPIVHCDLKPANILVNADGRPVVLDFGIATSLTPGGLEEEPPLDPYGSPRYASPEQMRGEPLQTTSDIYSLGVILYELLVGQAPEPSGPGRTAVLPSVLFHAGDETGAVRVAQPTAVAALRSTDVVTLAAHLDGDLDAIVARCLQPTSGLRYSTVDSLHEDLRRWLEGEPVTARPQTPGYLMSRFVGRHRGLVASAVVAALLILASALVIVYQWRSAVAARAQAESRFNDVKQLATSLFEVDAALTDIAGTTAVRATIVENASRYLDRLAQDSNNDASLAIELAESYRRVGDMLGNPNTPNLGRREEALQKYEVASQQLVSADRLRPNDPAVSLARARLEVSKGDVLLAQGQLVQAQSGYEGAAAIVQALLQRDSASDVLSRTLAGIYRPLGEIHLASKKPAEALQVFEKARALDLAALARDPESPEAQRLLALSQMRVAEALAAEGRVPDAIDTYREASRLLDALSTREPANVRLVRDVAIGRMKLAALVEEEKAGRAAAELNVVVATFRQLVQLDPRNATARRDLLVALVALGDVVAPADPSKARGSYLEALRIAEMLNAEPFNDPQAVTDINVVRVRLSGSDPELRMTLVRDGTNVPVRFDEHARPPAMGDEMRVSWRQSSSQSQYVLVFGGEGKASLLSRDEVAAAGWRIKANGPPPSQTLLLITSPHALESTDRAALIDRISNVPGPRRVPPDAQILWQTNKPERLVSATSARGEVDLDWPGLVKAALERVPNLRFSGRSFAVAAR